MGHVDDNRSFSLARLADSNTDADGGLAPAAAADDDNATSEVFDVHKVATGEAWLACQATDLGLVDELKTSDEYIRSKFERFDVIEVAEAREQPQHPLQRLLERGASSAVEAARDAAAAAAERLGFRPGSVDAAVATHSETLPAANEMFRAEFDHVAARARMQQ